MMMDGAELPGPWSADFVRRRPVRIRFRRGDGFNVQPLYEASDGTVVDVYYPRIMEADGHSLYAGTVCWDVAREIDTPVSVPTYLAEGDFEWL